MRISDWSSDVCSSDLVARAEIAELRPDDINSEHLPAATDELTAIVGSTEQATHTIFEAVEGIEALTEQMDTEVGAQVSAAVTSIFEACGFQDITGQRITKVVTALQKIETKIGRGAWRERVWQYE